MGLVLSLPHGMEAQGPEHSSARLERYLKLCDDDCTHVLGTEPGAPAGETVEQIMTRQLFDINWIVCYPTIPATLFHILRRQILMPFRKPLVRMSFRPPLKLDTFGDVSFCHQRLFRVCYFALRSHFESLETIHCTKKKCSPR